MTHPHILVVIDHHETRLYDAEFTGALPSLLRACDPRGELWHLRHTEGHFHGQRAPTTQATTNSWCRRARF